jgi:hypothetical protein
MDSPIPTQATEAATPATTTAATATATQPTVACLALFEGTTIELGNQTKTLTGLSFIEMGANRKVKIPGDTDLNIPKKGTVKASTGTPTKLPTGTIVGKTSGASTPIAIRVPACTLREPSAGNATTQLSEGTRIAMSVGIANFLILEPIDFEVG